MRDFNNWLSTFTNYLRTYEYYVDFEKVYRNANKYKVELNILNSLIGSKNIEIDFHNLVEKYPECLKAVPILLAVRSIEIYAFDDNGDFVYSFDKVNQSPEQYMYFMRETGLFDLMENKITSNLFDYAMGVETGLDSNARKNRGGHIMEELVEDFIIDAGFVKDVDYFKEMYAKNVESLWDIDLGLIVNEGKTSKRFDYVIKTDNNIYAIETNFYNSGGSKLNETSRSYKNLAIEAKNIEGFKFIWITDGFGWKSAKRNLQETFECMDLIFNINDLKNGILKEVII
ncbi:type II restriction endonuclease [Anaerococcus sp. NML200574]|uniref:type II restriction endonuclease n=1 Tax=Anaerococcus sp. NML200574 TaxID=2954486 RepID=UPI002238D829|nr:type II restriction endonuclease [Anaerococcus sp. NML200574]MCW6678498.1 type II restriction endonuclease [Anaerococcus sp. NML200574]